MQTTAGQLPPIVDPITPRQHVLRSLILLAVLLASRWWVLNHPIPVHGDEVGFMNGLGFPAPYPVHHPGYPLWIALGTAMSRFGLTNYAAFLLWSIVGSLAAPWLLYIGLRAIVFDGLAWWTSLAFGLNPLVWFTSVTALTYTCAVALGLLIIGLCWRGIAKQDAGSLIRAGLVMAATLWLRLDYLFLLGPLMLYALSRLPRPRPWRAFAPILVSFAFLIPATLLLYGRVVYGRGTYGQFSYWLEVLVGTSVFVLGLVDGLLRSAAKFFGILAWLFGLGTFLFIAVLFHVGRLRARFPGALAFLLVWTIPLTLFVVLVHMTEPGHIILIVPAGYCLVALWLESQVSPRGAVRIASAIALYSAIQFLAYPWSPQATGWRRTLNAKVAYLSASGLRQIDHRADIHTPGDTWPTATHKPAPK